MKSKKLHLIIAVDAFGDTHLEALAQTVVGWATWERIPESNGDIFCVWVSQ